MPFERVETARWWRGVEAASPDPAPDADTAGMLAAGHRALDRIAARAAADPRDAPGAPDAGAKD